MTPSPLLTLWWTLWRVYIYIYMCICVVCICVGMARVLLWKLPLSLTEKLLKESGDHPNYHPNHPNHPNNPYDNSCDHF